MREKRLRRRSVTVRRATLAAILLASSATADNGAPITQSDAVSSAKDFSLNLPPLPLHSASIKEVTDHPFLGETHTQSSPIQLTSGLADFIRGASKPDTKGEVDQDEDQDQKVYLAPPTSLKPSDKNAAGLSPKRVNRLPEPKLSSHPVDSSEINAKGSQAPSLAQRIRASADTSQESQEPPKEAGSAKIIGSLAQDASDPPHVNTKPKASSENSASLDEAGPAGKPAAELLSSNPRVQNVLPLPAPNHSGESEVETEAVQFTLSDQSPTNASAGNHAKAMSTNEGEDSAFSFSFTDRDAIADSSEKVTPKAFAKPSTDPDEMSGELAGVNSGSVPESEEAETIQEFPKIEKYVKSVPLNDEPISGEVTAKVETGSVPTVEPLTQAEPSQESLASDQELPAKLNPEVSPPVILQRPIATIKMVPVAVTDSAVESPVAENHAPKIPTVTSEPPIDAPPIGSIVDSQADPPKQAEESISVDVEPELPLVIAKAESTPTVTPAEELSSMVLPSTEEILAEKTEPLPVDLVKPSVSDLKPEAPIAAKGSAQNTSVELATKPEPKQHSKTRDAIVGLPKPWSLSWLLANNDSKAPSKITPAAQQVSESKTIGADTSSAKEASDAQLDNKRSVPAVETESNASATDPALNQREPLAVRSEPSELVDTDVVATDLPVESTPQLPYPKESASAESFGEKQPAHDSEVTSHLPVAERAVVVELPNQPVAKHTDADEELVEKPGAFESRVETVKHRMSPVAISAVPAKLQTPSSQEGTVDPAVQVHPSLAEAAQKGGDPKPPVQSQFAPHVQRVPLFMKRAQVRSLTIGGQLRDVRIGDTNVCQAVAVGPNRLKLIAAGTGTTELMVWAETNDKKSPVRMRIFKIHVENVDPSVASGGKTTQLLHEIIRNAFPECEVSISQEGGELIVSGRCASRDAAARIMRMVRSTCLVAVQDRLIVD